MRKSFALFAAAALTVMGMAGCSDSTSPENTLLGVGVQAGSLGGNGVVVGDPNDAVSRITIMHARVVIGRVEIYGDNDTVVYRSEEHAPAVLNLDLTGNTQYLAFIPVSPGSYSSSLIRIEKLEPTDSAVWNAQTEMRDISIRVEGYLNNDTNQPFLFTTTLDEEQSRDFAPVEVPDKGYKSVTFHFDYDQWFRDDAGGLINPDNGQLSSWRSTVEENIVVSMHVD